MTHFRCLTLALAVSLPIFAAGCSKPAMVPVQGKVTYRGYPVTNGVIVFAPERGPLAVGRIREDGGYALYTGDNPGAYPGNCRITVSSLAPGTSSESFGRFEFPRTALPDRYRDVAQSNLAINVAAGRPNTLDVELTD